MIDKPAIKLTPMERQYQELKARHRDKILFFRLGDFYEMFYEDAHTASEILGLTLTSRKGMPMAGFPHHAADSYIKKLVDSGRKVAVCEQMEDPAQAKGIVRRDIVKIFTPGTLLEESFIEDQSNNFLCSIAGTRRDLVLSFVDVSTGEFFVTEGGESDVYRVLQDTLARFQPSEILYENSLNHEEAILSQLKTSGALLESAESSFFSNLSSGVLLDSIEIDPKIQENLVRMRSLTGALNYLFETQLTVVRNIRKIRFLSSRRFVEMDDFTLRNLELVSNLHDGGCKFTLFSVINRTRTPMGSRLLKRNIIMPLLNLKDIVLRQDRVQVFYNNGLLSTSVQTLLREISDVERLTTRLVLKRAVPKDLVALAHSLEGAVKLKDQMKDHHCFFTLIEKMPDLIMLSDHIKKALLDEPSNLFKGDVIRTGYNAELDELRQLRTEGKQTILKMQERERKKTGIHSLKIKYNKVFGYFIEVSKANLDAVPDYYLRKQSLVNAERFTISELNEYEVKITTAADRIDRLEHQLFDELVENASVFVAELQCIAEVVAEIDVDCALGVLAVERGYCRPQLDESRVFEICDGRHPVVEDALGSGLFVVNDTLMDDEEQRILIVTGPNMAGKSTYLRQNALIAIMAQMGSFVSAGRAHIGLIDKIFTRIGASDNLSAGQSTFLVEMEEAANILNHCTNRSLIIMDELGRGTSTYDGLSIAWAVVEWLQEHPEQGGKTLFATHYHELTGLSERKGIKNLNVAVKERNDELIFLRKVLPGSADQSYGIHVAKLAGIPNEIIKRARVILENLETESRTVHEKVDHGKTLEQPVGESAELFPEYVEQSVLDQIVGLNPNRLTPIEALGLIFEWKERMKHKD